MSDNKTAEEWQLQATKLIDKITGQKGTALDKRQRLQWYTHYIRMAVLAEYNLVPLPNSLTSLTIKM